MAGIVVSTAAGGKAEVQGIGVASNAPSVNATASLQNAGDATPALLVDGYKGLGLQLTGSWTAGTIAVLGSMDGGVTFPLTLIIPMVPWSGGPSVATFTAAGNWECNVGQLTHVKVVAQTAITGGPVTALMMATNGSKSVRVGAPASNPMPVLDANNAAFTTAATMPASGGTPGRSVGVVCMTAGSIALTLSGGGSITLPVYAGWQTFPFAATGYSFSGGGAGSVYNLS